jgi:hypothetical protein
MTPRRILSPILALPFLAAPMGCDSGNEEKPAAAAADAEPEMSEQDKRIQARIQKRKDEEAAAQKAIDDAEAAKQEALDKITVLPEKLPKKLDKACAEVAEANDRFMLRLYEGPTVEKWNQAKGTQLGMTKANCQKSGSLEVAACQIAAMDAAGPELKKALPDIFKVCIEKFGNKEGGEKEAG